MSVIEINKSTPDDNNNNYTSNEIQNNKSFKEDGITNSSIQPPFEIHSTSLSHLTKNIINMANTPVISPFKKKLP